MITHFVVTEASRLSRPQDIAEAFILEERISSLGVKIIKVDSPGIDESTDEWHLFKTIQYAVAWYERKKICQRSKNGRVNRLKNGYRPFYSAPVGYLRERRSTKDYEDVIDPHKGPLIKEWLELFAGNVIETQSDLWKFRDKKWLLTNSNWTMLWRTFPEKVLQLHRLFYYASYIFYPNRGITEPLEGKHIGIISMDTARMIIKKLQLVHKKQKRKTISFDRMPDNFPLRWAVICKCCKRKYTARTTTRYRTRKDGKRTVKLYPYYGCANPNCAERLNVPKAKLEWEFADLLTKCKLESTIDQLIETLFSKEKLISLLSLAPKEI